MDELQVIVNQKPGIIEFNYTELRDALAKEMDMRKKEVFTEDQKPLARSEVAALRKLKVVIDDKRKEVKKQCLAPYEEFELKANELKNLIDEPINLINKQIDEMEERRKSERRTKIQSLYDSLIGDMADYIPLKKIYNTKWENASVTVTVIKKELTEIVNSTKTAVTMLNSMTSDAVPEAIRRYKSNLDLAGAISYINQYENQKAEILRREEEKRRQEEEQRRQQEEDRIRKQERERIAEEDRIRREEREKAEKEAVQEASQNFFSKEPDDDLPFEQPSTITAFYKVVATPEELEQVEMAFNSIGIFFERRDA
ncbi:MAG: DUF1351 domain-containing protein [Thermoflexaceae bacterium]|nr:DUF1351 domain-containing protein [Thermoflexaceae bacterium]